MMLLRLMFLGLACVSSAVFCGEENVEAHAISVVNTWNDLAKQPSVELHKNATARFGIQALSAPRFSGVMLYCMTEAYDPDDEADGDDGDYLGPYHLTVLRPGEDDERVERNHDARTHERGNRDYGRLVFGQAIALGKIGTYRVELRDSTDALVATAKIESLDAPFLPWTTLVNSKDDLPQDEELEGVSEGFIQTAAGRAGISQLAGNVPILYWKASGERGPRKFNEDDRLPVIPEAIETEPAALSAMQRKQAAQWIAVLNSEHYETRANASGALLSLGSPVAELLQNATRQTNDAESLLRLRDVLERLDGPFSIRMNGSNVLLKTPSFFPVIDVEHYFLARWWVNGKPVKPNEEAEIPDLSEQGGVPANKGARFKLQINSAALGAKPGDKIGLQLLFCPNGARELQKESAESVKAATTGEYEQGTDLFSDRFPLVSNRIEFKAP